MNTESNVRHPTHLGEPVDRNGSAELGNETGDEDESSVNQEYAMVQWLDTNLGVFIDLLTQIKN